MKTWLTDFGWSVDLQPHGPDNHCILKKHPLYTATLTFALPPLRINRELQDNTVIPSKLLKVMTQTSRSNFS